MFLRFTVVIWFHWKIFTIVCITNKDESSLGKLMQLLYTRIERMMPFVSFNFFYFLLPCLINASVSVYVCTIFIVSSLNKVMASDARLPLKLIAQTMQKYTHICLSVKVRIFECTVAVINMIVCVWVTRDSLIVFFVRFACVCVITCWSVVFASLLWVCLFAVKSHLHCN